MTEPSKCTKGWLDYLKLDIHSKCMCDRDMTGKVAIVTGANSGIGYEACAGLADKGAEVVMACRDKDRAEHAMESLKRENPNRKLSTEIVDVSDMKSVRDFVQRINPKFDAIDVLLNNAGVCTDPGLTPDGFEIHFATNHLGHFLLTNLLLDKLKKANDARVINVSSEAHRYGRYSPEKFRTPVSMMMAYGNSKLCNILFTKSLNAQLRGTTVSTFAVHPGLVNTNLPRDYKKYLAGRALYFAANTIGKPIVKDSKQGAQTLLHAILNKDLSSRSGSYLCECAVVASSPASRDIDSAQDLWKRSAEFSGLPAN